MVATEVRNLAGRSATAAKEIKALIQDSVAKVDEGSELVDESGQHARGDRQRGQEGHRHRRPRSPRPSREQSAGIEQVNKAVMQMDETTQQNAALVEEAAAASQAIVEQAQALSTMIARYNVGGESARPARSRTCRAPSAVRKDRPWSKSPEAARAPATPSRKVASAAGGAEWTEF